MNNINSHFNLKVWKHIVRHHLCRPITTSVLLFLDNHCVIFIYTIDTVELFFNHSYITKVTERYIHPLTTVALNWNHLVMKGILRISL